MSKETCKNDQRPGKKNQVPTHRKNSRDTLRVSSRNAGLLYMCVFNFVGLF